MGHCVNGWLLKVGHMTVSKEFNGIPFSGGAYFPLDVSLWTDIDPVILHCYAEVFTLIAQNYIEVMREMKITDAEYSLLKVINLFMPANNLSEDALKFIITVKLKYIETFNAAVYYTNPDMKPIDVMKRVSRLMDLLTIIEKASRMIDDIFIKVTMFDWAGMRGSLPYDMYVRKNDPKSVPLSTIVSSF